MKIRSTNQRSREQGLTLLEVLLALGLFAIAAVALTEALNEITLASVEATDQIQFTEQLRSYMTEATRAPNLRSGVTETEPDRNGVIFVTTIEEAQLETLQGDLLRNMYLVRVDAIRVRSGGERVVLKSAETYRNASLYAQ